MQLPSRRSVTSQGYNTNLENVHAQQYSPPSNPVFRHCALQGAMSSSSQQQGRYDSNFSQADSVRYDVSKPKNPVFQYCIEKMQGEAPQTHLPPPVCETSREQYTTQVSHSDRNFVTPCVSSNSYVNGIPPSSPTDTNPLFRSSGFSVTEMENKLDQAGNDKPGVAAFSNVCGQPTSPTSKGVNVPHLAGVGRARLHAEARKNNFGGICFSTTRTTGILLILFLTVSQLLHALNLKFSQNKIQISSSFITIVMLWSCVFVSLISLTSAFHGLPLQT